MMGKNALYSAVLLALLIAGCHSGSSSTASPTGGNPGDGGNTNTPPVASAGFDQSVKSGEQVTLHGGNSWDADDDTLTYLWSFTSVPAGSSLTNADLSDPTADEPTFTTDAVGAFVLSLTVNDGTEDSAPDTVTITAQNNKPVPNAGIDKRVITGSTVTLDGTGSSDPDNDSLTYQWSFNTTPAGSTLSGAVLTGPTPTFAPDLNGDYYVHLTVNDGTENSATYDRVIVTAGSLVANAGTDKIVPTNAAAALDGSGSLDSGGLPLTYLWSFSSIPAGSGLTNGDIVSATTATPSFTPDVDGVYVLSLTVNNGIADSDPDTVSLTASVPLDELTFTDANLAACVAARPETFVVQVTQLYCENKGVANLSGVENLTSLTWLHVGTNAITDISPLAGMTSLADLSLSNNSVTDISALANLTNLTTANLNRNTIADISPLADLSNLESLILSNNSVTGALPDLSGMTSLTELYIGGTSSHITGISGLAGLTSLQHLSADFSGVTDLSALSTLTGLISIQISGNSATAIPDLSGLTNLVSLYMDDNSISDISGLAGQPSIVTLHLQNNNITNISALSGLTSLHTLYLGDNTITDISPLSTLTGLTELSLTGNTISSLAPLSGLTGLTTLNLAGCGLTNISALAGLTGLTDLDLNTNTVTVLTPLAGLTNLQVLKLFYNNGITDVSALSGLTGLKELSLSKLAGWPGKLDITDISPLAGLTALQQLSLTSNAVTDVSPLAGMTDMRYLYLGYNSITTGVPDLVTMTSAVAINLAANTGIPCADLTTLTNALGPGIVTAPASCI